MATNPTEEALYDDVTNLRFGLGAPTAIGDIDEASLGFPKDRGMATVFQKGRSGPGPGGDGDDLVVFTVIM